MMGTLKGIYYRGVPQDEAGKLLARSERGTFGTGLYLADLECAAVYAGWGYVAAVEVDLKEVYRFKVPEDDTYFGEMVCIPLAHELYSLDGERIVNDAIAEKDFCFGGEIEEALVQLGCDALLVDYPRGSQELVVLRGGEHRLIDVLCTGDGQTPQTIMPQFLPAHWQDGIGLFQWLHRHTVEELFAAA